MRVSPSEQTVACEDQAIAARIITDGCFEHQREFKSRTLPRKPGNLSTEDPVELFHPSFAVRAGRECDRPIGMQMIDMRERQKRVQRSIDRRSHAILPKSGERIIAHHVVFVLFTPVNPLKLLQPVKVQKRETRVFNRPQIAPTSFHGEDACRFPGERVSKQDL